MKVTRRGFLARAAATSVALVSANTPWRKVLAGQMATGAGPYGAMGAPDVHGIRLPAGFTARLIGMSGVPVAGTDYTWHDAPDGGATFAHPDGGWVYVSNAEIDDERGGAGAVRFGADGTIVDAYRILSGTNRNCAGGATPWGTWLSCEEHADGLVWECDPYVPGQGIARPALGRCNHEAAAIDPATGYVYLTEDDHDSRLYRFRPDKRRDLSAGTLEAASLATDGQVSWASVSPVQPCRGAGTTAFARGEGAWFADGLLYFSTTADNCVWAFDPRTDRLATIYDAALLGTDAPLHMPDNLTVPGPSGDIYVGEDADDLQLVLLADKHGEHIAAPFLQLVGHDGSEVAGPAFSPDGSRLYFSSQRGMGGAFTAPGMTFEVSGPFRRL